MRADQGDGGTFRRSVEEGRDGKEVCDVCVNLEAFADVHFEVDGYGGAEIMW